MKRPAKEFSVLLVLLFIVPGTTSAQHDSLTLKPTWNSGILILKDHSTLKGFIHHDEKFRLIKFRAQVDDIESSFAEGRILSMEYYDNNTSKNRKFLTWEVKDEGSTIQGPALYEVVMVMKRFAVLSRKFGVIPNTQKGGMNVNNSKIEYDKIEKIFLADEDTPAELVWLGPSLKNETRMAVSPVKPFFTGDVLKKYTALHWREVKSFVSKNRLDLKRKTDLVKTLTYYHQLESADD